MMTKKRAIFYVVFFVFASFLLIGCTSKKDVGQFALKYLDEIFQGESDVTTSFQEEESAYQKKERYLQAFVFNQLLGEDIQEEGYAHELMAETKKIFSLMRYKVGKVSASGKGTYEVEVFYEPVDLMKRWTKAVKEEGQLIEQKQKEGAYLGTVTEQERQMQAEYLRHGIELYRTYGEELHYGDSKKTYLKVFRDDRGHFSMDTQEIEAFVGKIMGLDGIKG